MTNKQVGHQPSHIDRETWRQILKAAEELFLAKGYKGVSMKEVADVVQVTPAALYYHFPQGKEDLFMSVIQAMFEEWSAGISRAIAPAHSIRERLNLLTSYLLTLPVDHFPVLIQDAKEQIKDREKQRAIFRQLRGTAHCRRLSTGDRRRRGHSGYSGQPTCQYVSGVDHSSAARHAFFGKGF